MIGSNYLNRLVESLPAEMRLIRRAKSGEINAFVELCWSRREQIFRYLYFVSPNLNVAEGLTVQTFFKAWEQLKEFPLVGLSFETWLFSIAHHQIQEHYRTHKNSGAADSALTLSTRGGGFLAEYQPIHDSLHNLSADQRHVLTLKYIVGLPDKDIARILSLSRHQIGRYSMQALCLFTNLETFDAGMQQVFEESLEALQTSASSLTDGLKRHLDLDTKLGRLLKAGLALYSGQKVQPPPAFETYLQTALTEYLKVRTGRTLSISGPALRRTAIAFAMVVTAFLATGTAYAQAAVPGQPLYAWKRVSELVWHSLSLNPVATDILLAERRLDEWLAVADDPTLSEEAQDEYQKALLVLETSENPGHTAIIASALQTQQQELAEAGLSSAELDTYLQEVSGAPNSHGAGNTALTKKNPANPAIASTAHDLDADACHRDCKDDVLPAGGTSAKNGNAGENSGVGNGNAGGNNRNAGKDKSNNGKGPGNDNGGGNDGDNGNSNQGNGNGK